MIGGVGEPSLGTAGGMNEFNVLNERSKWYFQSEVVRLAPIEGILRNRSGEMGYLLTYEQR